MCLSCKPPAQTTEYYRQGRIYDANLLTEPNFFRPVARLNWPLDNRVAAPTLITHFVSLVSCSLLPRKQTRRITHINSTSTNVRGLLARHKLIAKLAVIHCYWHCVPVSSLPAPRTYMLQLATDGSPKEFEVKEEEEQQKEVVSYGLPLLALRTRRVDGCA